MSSSVSIPVNFIEKPKVNAEHLHIYLRIAYRCNANGFIWHKNETLEKQFSISKRSLQLALKALSDAKYLFIDYHVKSGTLYKRDYDRVIWLYDSYHGAKARLKGRKKRSKKRETTLPVFKRMIRQNYKFGLKIYTFDEADYERFGVPEHSALSLDNSNLLQIEYFSGDQRQLNTNEANDLWKILFQIFQEDQSKFEFLNDSNDQLEDKEDL